MSGAVNQHCHQTFSDNVLLERIGISFNQSYSQVCARLLEPEDEWVMGRAVRVQHQATDSAVVATRRIISASRRGE
jgi:hypothetical protein